LGAKQRENALLPARRNQLASDLPGTHIPDRFGSIRDTKDEFLRNTTGYPRDELEAGLVRRDVMTPPA
jgi:hypothetical protein